MRAPITLAEAWAVIADHYGWTAEQLAQAVQPSQAGELDYAQKVEIVSNWFSDEDMQSRAMQMLGDIEQAINTKKKL